MPDDHSFPAAGDPNPSPPALLDPRHWTPPKMAQFLEALAATQCVKAAAKSVGMSRQSAYRLRARLRGEPFDIAWEAAFRHGFDNLAQAALSRALNGVPEPVFYKGEKVGVRRRYDERLTVALLSSANRFGAPRLGRNPALGEWGLHSWEELIARVERGPALWTDDGEGEPEALFMDFLENGEKHADLAAGD